MENQCVLAVTANDNDSSYANRIIFTIKNTKLYVPVVTLSAKDNQTIKTFQERI